MIKLNSEESKDEQLRRKNRVTEAYENIKESYLQQIADSLNKNTIKKSKLSVVYEDLSIVNFRLFLRLSRTAYNKIIKRKSQIENDFFKYLNENKYKFYPSILLSVIIVPPVDYYEEIREKKLLLHKEYINKFPTARSYLSKLDKYKQLYNKKPIISEYMSFSQWESEYQHIAEILRQDTGDPFKNMINRRMLLGEYSETNETKLRRLWKNDERRNMSRSDFEALHRWENFKNQRDLVEKEWRLEHLHLNQSELKQELNEYISTHEYDVAYDSMLKRWTELKNSFKKDSKHVYDEIRNIVKTIKGLNNDVLLDESITLFRARAIDDLNESNSLDIINSVSQELIRSNLNSVTEMKFFQKEQGTLSTYGWVDLSKEINNGYLLAGNVKANMNETFLKSKYNNITFQGYPEESCGAPPSPLHKKSGGRWDKKEDMYLYLATCGDLAIYEISPYIDQIISLGMSKPKRILRVLNLIYDEFNTYKKRFNGYTVEEIWALPDIISIVSMGNEENYLLTRILSEIAIEEGYDGIIYRSRLFYEREHNIVIFNPELIQFTESKLMKVKRMTYDISYCSLEDALKSSSFRNYEKNISIKVNSQKNKPSK